jgi:hypothetical protein
MPTVEKDRLFDDFTHEAFRLEQLQTYSIPQEADRLAAFRVGRPLPTRSVRNNPWLRRMALSAIEGKAWPRVRIVEYPLTEYTRFELAGYVESTVAGQTTLIAERHADPALADLTEDFWLFDSDTDHAVALLMRYDNKGRFLGSEASTDPATLARCKEQRDLAIRLSIPLHDYLSTHLSKVP